MASQSFIWITDWERFQHYRMERGKSPAWIKATTRQLFDDEYRSLSAGQRALLHETRLLHAHNRLVTTADPRALSQLLGRRVTKQQLEALNHAGFIEVISRQTLDRRLEQLYKDSRPTRARPRARREVEEEEEKSTVVRNVEQDMERSAGWNGDEPAPAHEDEPEAFAVPPPQEVFDLLARVSGALPEP